MKSQILSHPHLILIITAVLGGTIARFLTLREDYRQYPSFPNGYLNQAFLGLVSATLGAFVVPSVMTNNLTAVTFLALAITQFQGVRKIELDSLKLLEETEYARRGNAYIDGIAKTFESRNYISLLVSLTISIIMEALSKQSTPIRIGWGLFGAAVIFLLLTRMTKGTIIADLADVKPAQITIKNNELFADDIFVTNRIGIERGQEMILEEGLAIIITPKEQHYRIPLENYGQREAILFEITRALGLKRYHFSRKSYKDGRVAYVAVPILKDLHRMIQVARHAPVLESTKKTHFFLKKWEERHGRS